MKALKNFKILFQYFKEDKFELFLYVSFTILKYLEPLVTVFLWANVFQALTDGNQNLFIKNLLLWSLIVIIAWVFIQTPADLIYNKLEKKFMESVNKDLYVKVSNLPAVAFENMGTGEFINRMYNDPDKILELLARLIKLFCRLVVALVIVIISFMQSVIIGVELLVLCVIMFILSNVYYPRLKKINEDIKKDADDYVKIATQNITGIREIKALGIKENINRKIFKNIESLFYNQRKIGRNEFLYYGVNNLCFFIMQFIIIFTLGIQVFNGDLKLASFVIFESYIWRIDDVVESLSDFGTSFNKVMVALGRIGELLNNELYEDEKFGLIDLNDQKCEIEFKNVKFKYRDDEELILKGLSMNLKPNKKIAIVGKSGQGKSTLFNLLLRYFDYTSGSIKINNIDIKQLTEKSLRDNISVIRQSPYLFNATIMENFRVVNEDVTLDEVREVCKKAYIDDYIMSLPDKYDTLIGEGGVNLSGGQKQRIAIARTLLKNTKVILFDEATSALDNESQEYIKKTIDDLVSTHTIVIVAHRLSTIMDADEIFIVDDGKVVSSGTHDELMKNSELYKKLYTPEVLDF